MEIVAKIGTLTFESKATDTQVYDLNATAKYEVGGNVKAIEGGIVRKENKQVAGFSQKGETQFSIDFIGAEKSERDDILADVSDFIESIQNKLNA